MVELMIALAIGVIVM
ncbi:hypothetical protein C7E14_22810, partial [Stenotrophomonas maltophilia]